MAKKIRNKKKGSTKVLSCNIKGVKTIEALIGSIIVTPKEIKALKKHGIDLKVLVKKIQKEIYGRASHKW